MAQKLLTVLTSDLSGEDIPDGKGETVVFSLDGTNYELDLTLKEADKFRGEFQNYIAAGRKVGRAPAGRKSSSRTGSGSGRSSEELGQVRAWAKEQGMEVSERGRIKQDVLDAYDAAN